MANQTLTETFLKHISTTLKNEISNLYIAFGVGSPTWDNLPELPEVSPQQTKLMTETLRLPVASIEYQDPSTGKASEEPTTQIRVTSPRVSSEELTGSIRECGIIYKATTTSADELLLYSVFRKINITEQITITKNLIITFN